MSMTDGKVTPPLIPLSLDLRYWQNTTRRGLDEPYECQLGANFWAEDIFEKL